MSSVLASSHGSITLNFAWKGPNSIRGGASTAGGLEVSFVDLNVSGSKGRVSVSLPKDIHPDTELKLPFRGTHLGNIEGVEFAGSSLKMTTDHIRNLVVVAGFFEKGEVFARVVGYNGITTEHHDFRRSFEIIKLSIPSDLEMGQTYKLVVSSMSSIGLRLSANLVKEVEPSSSSSEPDSLTVPECVVSEELLSILEVTIQQVLKERGIV